ncbi:hypothetical protein BDZ97DRAFT_38683 [Flammula alnicola]|nr:hypothetical protein BDZ97DRAFT_38683 [Flammula alnicola]
MALQPKISPIAKERNTNNPNEGIKIKIKQANTHLQNALVGMSQGINRNARAEVEVFLAVRVPHVRTLPVVQHEVGPVVHMEHVFLEARNRALRLGREWRGRDVCRGQVGFRGLWVGRLFVSLNFSMRKEQGKPARKKTYSAGHASQEDARRGGGPAR